jgi:hypothetical protein
MKTFQPAKRSSQSFGVGDIHPSPLVRRFVNHQLIEGSRADH